MTARKLNERTAGHVAVLTLTIALITGPVPAARDAAPPRPWLAGQWLLEGDPQQGPWSPFGSRVTAAQDDTLIVFDGHSVMTMDPDGPASITVDGPSAHIDCAIGRDLREHYAPMHDPGSELGMVFEEPLDRTTRCDWEGNRLVTVSHTSSRVTAPDGIPVVSESQSTDWMSVVLDGPDRMIVERVRVSDLDLPRADSLAESARDTTIYVRSR